MFPITDNVLIFTVIMSVILFSLLVGAKLKIPDLVLLLIAGAFMGEHGFHVLERSSAITLFGEIGLIFIMFLAGLEIDLYQFSRTKSRSVGFGLLTFIFPQVLGTIAVRYALDLNWTASVLMASMFASHTLLAYPAAARLGIHRTEPVTISVGATIITDTLALLVLAVVADAAEGEVMNPLFWGGLILGLIILVVLITQLIPRLARWFFQHVTESGGAQFLFVLALVGACAYLSEYARMKPIIGAFLAGAAFNHQIPEHSPLMNRLAFAGNNLFIPFFLISVGMMVEPNRLIGDWKTWEVIIAMVVLVIITKGIAAWVAAKIYGYNSDERGVMFGLTVVQAAATLAAALVGFEAGILDENALNGAIAMIMVTVPLGTWVTDRYGRRVAMAAKSSKRITKITEQRMVLSVSNPVTAARLTDLAFLMRDTSVPGAIYPLTIVREQTDTEEAVSRGEKLLAQCMTQASAADVSVEPHVRVDLNVSDGIIRAVRELRGSTVLAGWGGDHNRGSRILGTINQSLTQNCPSRLILCRITRPPNTTRVLRFPFPPLAEHRDDLGTLIRETKLLAKQIGAQLHVYLSGKAAVELEARIEKTSPGCDTTYIVKDTWTESRKRMFEEVHEDDLIVLPQIRRNTLLWTPTLDSLPELIARHFPYTNLLIAYPGLSSNPIGGSAPVVLPATSKFPAVHGVDLPPELDGPERIQQLLDHGLSDDPDMADDAYPLLLDSAKLNPIELTHGVILIHGHCGQKENSVLLVGCGESDQPFLSLPHTPNVIVALISPRGDTPEIHLRALAAVARRFRDQDVTQAIDQAGSAQEICTILSPGTGE